jgi:poly [ADP-ribose] polymerase
MTTTIVERVELVKTSARENSNKFYSITLYDNGDVVCRWGRVGAARGESQTHAGGGTVKLRQIEHAKTGRGYRRVHAGASPSSTASGSAVVHAAARAALSDGADETEELIGQLARVNRHAIQIASGGLITATAVNGVQTARGPVSAASVAEARTVLASASAGDLDAIDRYLMLVPQVMPRTAGWHAQFADTAFLASQRDFLDQLDAAVAISPADGATAGFRYRLAVLPDGHGDADQLRARFERTRNEHHRDVVGLRMLRVWALTDTTGAAGWAQTRERLGGETRQLWHGTVPANVLSILHRGLYVPPSSGTSIQITGRMFGAGVYLSDQSSKSLRYSHGSWSGTRQDHCYMLAADVAMGRELRTGPGDDRNEVVRRMRQGEGTGRRRYDSLVVSAGTCGVINNEMIVPDSGQILLKYVCEFR